MMHKDSSTSMRHIECRGEPREMGRQYGEQARADIIANLQAMGLGGALNVGQKEYARKMRALLEVHAPDVLDELIGISEGGKIPEEKLILENCAGTPAPQCTSVAVSSGPDGPVLGKNNDGETGELRWTIRHTRPSTGLPMIQVLCAGWLSGLDSMNAAGLVNTHNSVGSVFPRPAAGMEIRLWTYRLMTNCPTACRFIESLALLPLTGKGFNIAVADAENRHAVLECALPRIILRGENDGFVYATNHYVSDELKNADTRTPGQKKISMLRFNHLSKIERENPPASKEDIRRLLSSHEPWAPCRHGGEQKSHTLWSFIALPREQRVEISSGAPCENEYIPYEL